MNANIMKTKIFHRMKYDLKDHIRPLLNKKEQIFQHIPLWTDFGNIMLIL